MYEKYFKRALDCALSALALFLLSPLLLLLAVTIRVRIGKPVLFKQRRPGRGGKVFLLYKFRTMTGARGADGNLLPDDLRMTKYGSLLRAASLDELPELVNILKGEMSIVGPRPQLVKDMLFMTEEQRRRHSVLPGLTGLAQVHGRNRLSWEEKFTYDLRYIRHITFWGDVKILLQTVAELFRHSDVHSAEMATAEDLGDYLLRTGKVDERQFRSTLEGHQDYAVR